MFNACFATDVLLRGIQLVYCLLHLLQVAIGFLLVPHRVVFDKVAVISNQLFVYLVEGFVLADSTVDHLEGIHKLQQFI